MKIPFTDREEAGRLLAAQLGSYIGKHPLVLGIPRGSVPMAALVAKKLRGELDVALVHKIGAPGNPEFAIGAVNEFGDLTVNEAADFFSLSNEFVKRQAKHEQEVLRARRKSYGEDASAVDPRGRIVIIVDDGIATGSTMLAAVQTLRKAGAARVVVAAPVASKEAAAMLSRMADEVVVLHVPPEFYAVGEFYEQFDPVTDEEVVRALEASRARRMTA